MAGVFLEEKQETGFLLRRRKISTTIEGFMLAGLSTVRVGTSFPVYCQSICWNLSSQELCSLVVM